MIYTTVDMMFVVCVGYFTSFILVARRLYVIAFYSVVIVCN